MKTAPLLLALTAIATQAHASSPEAWAQLDKAVIDSCVKISQLKNARPAGTAALFDDTVGYNALLIKGQYLQPHMKGKTGTELCLYNRKEQKAVSTDWSDMTTLPKR
ncbi:hypothetical protein ACW9H6_17075 [Pseudomonas sp. SDO528_S397]